jgi:surface carbohydrate biosynthesis protein (TIGR04326 family)
MHLNYFFSESEASQMPFPDRIITSGRYDEEVFIKDGFPRAKVKRGGAIRYGYLFNSAIKGNKAPEGDKPLILITTSISEMEAIELILQAKSALAEKHGYRIIIKCHPFMPFSRIQKDLNLELPAHFSISSNKFDELIKDANVLIYSGSTTCIEAISHRVPVIHMGSEFRIDLDQLEFDKKIKPSLQDWEDLPQNIEKAIAMKSAEKSEMHKRWQKAMDYLFCKVDDSVYALFTRPK